MTLNKAKGRMFKSVGWTWNPVAGCTHGCPYCWARTLTQRWGRNFEPQFREHFLKDKMPDDGSWIFVGSMGDLFCEGMKDAWILGVLTYIRDCEADNKFLLQTKNPARYLQWAPLLEEIKDKVILGTTIETNRDLPWQAPPTLTRYECLRMMKNDGFKTFLSLEPLADFDEMDLQQWILYIDPEAVEMGRENYTKHTVPAPDEKIVRLCERLVDNDIEYVLKENLRHLEENPE